MRSFPLRRPHQADHFMQLLAVEKNSIIFDHEQLRGQLGAHSDLLLQSTPVNNLSKQMRNDGVVVNNVQNTGLHVDDIYGSKGCKLS